jgi:hypothetical protein
MQISRYLKVSFVFSMLSIILILLSGEAASDLGIGASGWPGAGTPLTGLYSQLR